MSLTIQIIIRCLRYPLHFEFDTLTSISFSLQYIDEAEQYDFFIATVRMHYGLYEFFRC